MIDHLDRQLQPLDRALHGFARRQPGCRVLQQLFGVGAITSVAILAELGDCRRFASSDDAVRHCGLDVTVWSSAARPGTSPARGRSCCAGRSTRPRSPPRARARPTTPTTSGSASASTTTAPVCRSRASSAGAPTTSCARSTTRRSQPLTASPSSFRTWPRPPDNDRPRAEPLSQPMTRGRLPHSPCRHDPLWTTSKDRAAATHPHGASRPIDIMSTEPPPGALEHRDKAGALARKTALQPTEVTAVS
jgi:hypothetical protein